MHPTNASPEFRSTLRAQMVRLLLNENGLYPQPTEIHRLNDDTSSTRMALDAALDKLPQADLIAVLCLALQLGESSVPDQRPCYNEVG